MGCFLACFGSPKDAKRRKYRPKLHPRDQFSTERIGGGIKPQESTGSVVLVKPISPAPEIREKEEEEKLSVSTRKRVTFDSNVRTYEHVSLGESREFLLEEEEQEIGVKREDEKGEGLVKPSQSHSLSKDSSITSRSSSGSYPSNHRYQNCRDSDDELDYEGSDLDDNDDGYSDLDDDEDDGRIDSDDDGIVVDSNSKVVPVDENDASRVVNGQFPEREVRGKWNVRDRSVYVNSVLNPVENLNQWKVVKAKGATQLKEKENLTLDKELQPPFSSEPSFKELPFNFKGKSDRVKKSSQEMAVDASLSTWLGSSESAPANKPNIVGSGNEGMPQKTMSFGSSSPVSFDDRPILGALTLEELKQFSASSSPRKSPGHNPDEMAIIGSVGTYWNHSSGASNGSGSVCSCKGIPNSTSKYREDKRVNWHSTPFEARLERALNGDTAHLPTNGSNVY